jgi:hypothetical protein
MSPSRRRLDPAVMRTFISLQALADVLGADERELERLIRRTSVGLGSFGVPGDSPYLRIRDLVQDWLQRVRRDQNVTEDRNARPYC